MTTENRSIVGLDFGMTNSLLTYYDDESGPQSFIASSASSSHEFSIPTVVARKREGVGWIIGIFARNATDFTQHFKVALSRLGKTASERARNNSFKDANTFLGELFKDYSHLSNGIKVESIVVTVPETWVSGTEQGGTDALRQILSSIEPTSKPRFVSESVAAACYFTHLHKKAANKPFDGHVLVYDHGGSTLDISLVRVYDKHIGVASRLGSGREISAKGFGGVLFDEHVMDRIAGGDHVESGDVRLAKLRGRGRQRWLNEFERQKRIHTAQIEAAINHLDFEQHKNEVIFDVFDYQVKLRHLIDVFETVFDEHIRKNDKSRG